MRSKKQRQKCILNIMEQDHFHTQQEVAYALHQNGFEVSQSTLSKDFKELKLVKAISPGGSFKYVLPQYVNREIQAGSARREIEDFVTGVDSAANLVVLKTASGNASGVCETIDQSDWSEIIGTIAGENTILIICKTPSKAKHLMTRIQTILDGIKELS